jgi:hypothetical protein
VIYQAIINSPRRAMTEIKETLAGLSLVFVIGSMVSMGLRLKMNQIIAESPR